MEDKIDYEINDKVTYKYIMEEYQNEQGIKKNFFRILALRNYFNAIKPDVIISFLKRSMRKAAFQVELEKKVK